MFILQLSGPDFAHECVGPFSPHSAAREPLKKMARASPTSRACQEILEARSLPRVGDTDQRLGLVLASLPAYALDFPFLPEAVALFLSVSASFTSSVQSVGQH